MILENEKIKLVLNDETAAVQSFTSKLTGWDFVARKQAEESLFRMMLPLEEHFNTQNEFRSKRNNVACGGYGKPQVKMASPREVTFSWNQVESAFGGVHDIAVSATIRLTDEAAFFSMDIDNQSDVVVENLYYPCFAAVTPPDWDKNFEFFTRSYINPVRMPIYPNFQNTRGYFGVDHPIMYSGANPQVPYVLLRNEEQGMCVMIGERTMDPLFFIMELFPGWDESMTSHWSHQETVSGKEVYAAFYAGQLPFIRPGEKRAAISVMLEPYTGGWDSGADVYVKYKKQYFKTCDTPDWLKHPHSWLQYQMNSPEDELRLRFRDLPELAADCLKAGITAIQLVGWNDGGQDQGNPSHNFDPRLGTKEEFYQAIKTCQDMGVKIILFSKFNWVDEGTKWYEEELKNYVVRDPFGNPYQHGGYQYQTLSQLSNVRVKHFNALCFNYDKTMALCKEEFDKMIASGAAGNLYDECFHRTPTWLCFDERHGHRVPAPSQGMDIAFANQMLDGAPKDFLMAGEALYDNMFESYHLSYARTEDPWHIPLERYVADGCRIMTAVTGFSDRNMLNQCLLYNYIVSYEPYNFKGWPKDAPETIAYGKKVHEIRCELEGHLWNGKFLHTRGVCVTKQDGTAHHPYSVFENRADGTFAAVIANYDLEREAKVTVACSTQKMVKWRLVDGAWQPPQESITLPPKSAAVVLFEK